MDDAALVRDGDGATRLHEDLDRLGGREPPALPERLLEILSFESLHREVRARVLEDARVVNAHDVLGLEHRGGARFTQKPMLPCGRDSVRGIEELDRDGATEALVECGDDHAHPAATDLALHPIAITEDRSALDRCHSVRTE